MSHWIGQSMCYIFGMRGRATPTILCAMMAALLMLSAVPADMQVSPAVLAGLDSVDQAGGASAVSAHSSSAHQSCASPDCHPESDCPPNMTMSDCDMSGVSCSLCGTTVLAHRPGEFDIHRGGVVAIQDPPNLILTTHSTNIFHPPRLAS